MTMRLYPSLISRLRVSSSRYSGGISAPALSTNDTTPVTSSSALSSSESCLCRAVSPRGTSST